MSCPWLQFTHSPCRSHSDSELGGEDVYHAVELPASQLVCHSLRPETQKERGGMGEGALHLFPSIPPSLALLTFEPVFPSSPLAFIFLVFACPLRAKGLLRSVWMCVNAAGYIWLLHQTLDFPLHAWVSPMLYL